MKKVQGHNYLYDGSFIGFLSALHFILTDDRTPLSIQSTKRTQELLFKGSRYLPASTDKARAIWKSLEEKGKEKSRLVYFAFLSENTDIELLIYRYTYLLFKYTDPDRSEKLNRLTRHLEILEQRVSREKQQLEKSLNFVQLEDGLLSVQICPHHNVLPLISKFYRNRYGHRNWLISDSKRNYSLLSRNGVIEMVSGEASIPAKNKRAKSLNVQNAESYSGTRALVITSKRGAANGSEEPRGNYNAIRAAI
ncbi:DUF4130 domain-containing protein [Robiginitalea sp. IMCC44478]|uniref:DUF4130 domain-containing protein n=1 Tax=Robiginitalea sp. IMCC44478 TaxID=3459122 RepID=UPI004042CEBF